MSDAKRRLIAALADRLSNVAARLSGFERNPAAGSTAEGELIDQLRRASAWQSAVGILADLRAARRIADRQPEPPDLIQKAKAMLTVIGEILRPTVEAHRQHDVDSPNLLVENLTSAGARFAADMELLAAELRIADGARPDLRSQRVQTLAQPSWQPPEGYVGAKDILLDARFKKGGKNPPRSTLQDWERRSKKSKSPVRVEKAPDTKECYYPEAWIFEQIRAWNPRRSTP